MNTPQLTPTTDPQTSAETSSAPRASTKHAVHIPAPSVAVMRDVVCGPTAVTDPNAAMVLLHLMFLMSSGVIPRQSAPPSISALLESLQAQNVRSADGQLFSARHLKAALEELAVVGRFLQLPTGSGTTYEFNPCPQVPPGADSELPNVDRTMISGTRGRAFEDHVSYVMRLRIRGTSHKAVLAALAARCGADHSCTVSRWQLAQEAGTGLDRLKDVLRELRHGRFVSTVPQHRADGGRDANRFVLHGPWDDWGGSGTPFPKIEGGGAEGASVAGVRR